MSILIGQSDESGVVCKERTYIFGGYNIESGVGSGSSGDSLNVPYHGASKSTVI